MRKRFILILAALLLFKPQQSAHACSPSFEPNYWFQENITIDESALPPNVTVQLDERGYIVVDQYYQETEIDLAAEELVYIVSRADDRLDSGRLAELQATYDQTGESPVALLEEMGRRISYVNTPSLHRMGNAIVGNIERNPQTPGGITTDVPEPFESEIWFATPAQLYRVPVTVEYEINRGYDPSYVVFDASVTDYALGAESIVVAEVVDYPESIELEAYLESAEFRVDRWLKGSGDEYINIGAFGSSATCLMYLPKGKQIFMLSQKTNGIYWTMIFGDYWSLTEEAKIIEILGQPPTAPTSNAPAQTLTPPPTVTQEPQPTNTQEALPTETATPTQTNTSTAAAEEIVTVIVPTMTNTPPATLNTASPDASNQIMLFGAGVLVLLAFFGIYRFLRR